MDGWSLGSRDRAAAVEMRDRLRRAVRLGVREARAEREKRRELDARFELKMDQIASSHLELEQMMKESDRSH